MKEIMVKTHLIITDIHEEYSMKWCGSIIDTKPLIKNGKPIFIIRSKMGAIEMNTVDMKYLEEVAKDMTAPRGRSAITTDVARINIKQVDNTEKTIGILTHNHIKKFAPMYDAVYYK